MARTLRCPQEEQRETAQDDEDQPADREFVMPMPGHRERTGKKHQRRDEWGRGNSGLAELKTDPGRGEREDKYEAQPDWS